jgi:hypothetical protein
MAEVNSVAFDPWVESAKAARLAPAETTEDAGEEVATEEAPTTLPEEPGDDADVESASASG